MPSALETLVKILKLEREQGFKNTAVIGGLAAFCDNWVPDARAQAKRPEHHKLVDEVSVLLKQYEGIEARAERQQTVGYIVDRIMGRVPPPPEYQVSPDERAAAQEQMELPRRQERQESPGDQTAQEAQPASPSPENTAAEAASPPSPVPVQREEQGSAPGEPRDRAHDDQQRRDARAQEQRPANQGKGGQQNGQPNRNAPQSQQANPQNRGGSQGGSKGRPPQQGYRPGPPKGDNFEDVGDMFDFNVSHGGPAVLDLPARPRLARPPRKARVAVNPEAAADTLRGLSASVDKMKGVGPQKAAMLENLGIRTINDLLFTLPRRYDDYTLLLPIRRLQPGMVATVVGTVRQADVRVGKNNRKDFQIVVDDGSAPMTVVFFGQGMYLGRALKPGMQIVLRGAINQFGSRLQMTNPEWERMEAENAQQAGIIPVYSLTEGLYPREYRRILQSAVDYWADRVPDYMPEAVLERGDLADLGWTIRQLHFPESFDHLMHAKRRFIFDQLIALQMAILAQRREWQGIPAEPLSVGDDWLDTFMASVFPYELTGAQKRAIQDIRGDISRDVPMNRLLQGDVGSGKTAVAITALAMAFVSGRQSAIMAPTSILAEQHYRNISRALENIPGEQRPVIALLTSALTTTERESAYRGIADGSIDLVIGTHAVIQEGVEFKNLALAVVDEQHRFGVEQRKTLRGKGTNPHLLVMTATPIPRTLALTLYADLDLTVMDEMPPGRQPVQTRVLEPKQRERALNFVGGQLEQGRQAFIVYPLVEASEKIEAESAVESYDKLQKVFYEYKIGLLHGRMSPKEKDETMKAFSDKVFDLLVTTSVAEVGVDIPNATVIMIEGANRFGLAQLHQFRGRVGRGSHASYCLLVSDAAAADAQERLRAMEMTTDGFKLAEIDWQIRGPGDLVGTRQSGSTLLQVAEDIKPDLVDLAQREAKTLFEEDPNLEHAEHRLLKQRVAQLHDDRSDLS